MSTVKKIAANTVFLIAGKIIGILLQMLIIAYLARYLGTAGYGKYAFAFAFISFFQVLASLGFNSILVREISRDKSLAPSLIGHGIVIRFFLSIISFSLAIAIISLLKISQDTTSAVSILSLILLLSAFQTPEIIFQVYLELKYSVLINLGNKLLILGLVLFAISKGKNLNFFIWIAVATNLILVLGVLIFSKKFVKLKFSFNSSTVKWIIKESWPMALSAIFITVYFKIDTIMLSLMKGDEAVGYYNAAYAIMSNLIFIPGAYATSIFPIISSNFKSSPDSLAKIFKRSFKYLSTLALPIVLGGFILAKEIILLIYGEEYLPSVQAFQILIFAVGIIFISQLVSSNITAINKQKINMWLTLINVFLNITLNFLLIPLWSFIGASIATVATEGTGALMALLYTMKYLKIPVLSKSYLQSIRLLISAGIMVGVIYLMSSFHVIPRILFGGISYVVGLFLLRWFDQTDMEMFRQAIKLK